MESGTRAAIGRGRRRIRWDWVLLGALYVLALVMRLQLVDSDYFSDEPMSYALSRHGFDAPTNVRDMDGGPTTYYVHSWFLERPAFYTMMMPAGQISFHAYRVEYILVAALLAPLALELLRALGVRLAFSVPVGLAVALHPQFFVWGAITHMDTPMTVALAAGLLANLRGHHRAAGALFVTACWMKETAMPFLVFVFAFDLLGQAWRERRIPWPIQFDGRRSALFVGILFGFLPFLLAQEMGFGLPGERSGGHEKRILDSMWLSLWFLPLVIGGLVWSRTRQPALWALALPAFYLGLHIAFEWNVREWYLVGSSFFALIAAAAFLDEIWTRVPPVRRPLRAVPAAIGVAALLLLGAGLLQPDSEAKRQWQNPLSKLPSYSIEETLERESVRDLNGRGLLAAIRDAAPGRVFLIDVHYAFVQHPIPLFVDEVRNLDSNRVNGRLRDSQAIAGAIEDYADLTVIGKKGTYANQAILQTYADCIVRDEETYVFVDGRQCPGRFEQLFRALALPEATP